MITTIRLTVKKEVAIATCCNNQTLLTRQGFVFRGQPVIASPDALYRNERSRRLFMAHSGFRCATFSFQLVSPYGSLPTHTHLPRKGATMKPLHMMSMLLVCSGILWSSCRAERGLWIEVKENGTQKTIAVTEAIARKLLDTKETKVRFTEKGKQELVTREILQGVLDGRERSRTVHDDHGSEITLSMKPLSIPGERSGNNRLVLKTYKSGKQTFRIALPELNIDLADDESKVSVHADVDWKEWLPFLAKAGGAVYFKDHDDDTEVWIYVE